MQNALLLILLLACLALPSWLYAKDKLPQLTLAKHFKGAMEHSAYWVSEKLDGIRCYWDGEQLYTRKGKKIHAPAWFTADLPKQALDGELWIARGSYQLLTRIVLDQKPDLALWRQVSYQLFDLPHYPAPFEMRQAKLKSLIKNKAAHIQLVHQEKFQDLASIEKKLKAVVQAGGEGLMLRSPNSLYQAGRSDNLIKMKLRQDAEAKVIAYQAGRGKFENMMGAIWVEMPNGQLFKIGTGFTVQQRKSPPPIGSEITYSYQGLTEKGLPRFASFERIRVPE